MSEADDTSITGDAPPKEQTTSSSPEASSHASHRDAAVVTTTAASGAAGLVYYSRKLGPGLGRAPTPVWGMAPRVVGGRVLGRPSGAEASIPG